MGVVEPLAGGDGVSTAIEGRRAFGSPSTACASLGVGTSSDGFEGPRMGDCIDEIDADDMVSLRGLWK